MKKHFLFVIKSFSTGGIVRSLQNFLNQYDTQRFEVDVFVMVHQDIFEGQLNNCKLLPCNRFVDYILTRFDSQKGFKRAICALSKILDQLTKGDYKNVVYRKVANELIKKKKYDAVIGFSESEPTFFVASMNHPNKIGWIHCDYASYYELIHRESEKHIYDKLNTIVCVSNYTLQSFVSIYPEFKNKTCFIYNIIDDRMMREQATCQIDGCYEKEMFNIVSIGRLDPIKRLSMIPQIARKVIDAGCSIRWYVIGPQGGKPDEKNLLLRNIKKYDVDSCVIPLGEKKNPYPYIAQADLLVNTSISEACPYVVNEAKILGTPVICTDFGSAKEFVDYGKSGYYLSIDQIPKKIIQLIKDPRGLNTIRNELSHFKYDNQEILNKIYSLV